MTLTQRELEVLRLLKEGKTQAEIAKALDISQPAVSSFKRNGERKIREADDLIKRAKDLGLLLLALAFFLGGPALAQAFIPNPGHSAYSVGPGTNGSFYPGNYTFPNNLDVADRLTVTGTANFTQNVFFSGNISIPSGANLSAEQICLNGDCRTAWPTGSSGNISGSFASGYVPYATNGTNLGNSNIYYNGSNIGIGDTNPTELFVVGNGDLFQVTSNGYARGVAGANTSPSFSFVLDPDTGIYNPSANQLAITTGGTQRAVVNSSGLFITGTGQIQANTGSFQSVAASQIVVTATLANYGIITPSGSSLLIGELFGDLLLEATGTVSSNSTFTTRNNTYLADGAGRVGINTTSPNQLLDVRGNANVSGIVYTPQICLNGVCQTDWAGLGSSVNITNDGTATRLGKIDNLDPGQVINNIYVAGTRAYIADAWFNVSIVDITDPREPRRISMIDVAGARDVYESGGYLHILSAAYHIFDVQDPYNPIELVEVGITDNSARRIEVEGSRAYIARDNGSRVFLDVYEITNLTNPALLDSIDFAAYDDGMHIQVEGDLAYVATADRFRIVNVSNPRNLALLDDYNDTIGSNVIRPYDFKVRGPYAYIASYYHGLVILDVSNPNAITYVNSTNVGLYEVVNIDIAGNYAYLGTYAYNGSNANGTVVLDITNASAITEAGWFPIESQPATTVISGRYLFAGGNTETRIYDIGGIDTVAATIGSLQTDSLNVRRDATIAGGLDVDSSLTVGAGGIRTSGQGSFGDNLLVDGAINASGTITGNAGFDLAEMFSAQETMGPGDLVIAVDEDTVRLATRADADLVIGAVSTQPGFVLANPTVENPVLIGLAGRIPVKVQGTVQRGDFITISDTPGVGEAAREPGFVIGRAISDVRADNTVMIIIQPTYFSPQVDEQNRLVGTTKERTFEMGLRLPVSIDEQPGRPVIENRGQDRVVALGTGEDTVVTLG